MSKKRRNHGAAFKAKVPRAIKGERTFGGVSQRFEVHQNLIVSGRSNFWNEWGSLREGKED